MILPTSSTHLQRSAHLGGIASWPQGQTMGGRAAALSRNTAWHLSAGIRQDAERSRQDGGATRASAPRQRRGVPEIGPGFKKTTAITENFLKSVTSVDLSVFSGSICFKNIMLGQPIDSSTI
jgi:hypothetical protein